MSKHIIASTMFLCVLTLATVSAATWIPVHQVASDKPFELTDGDSDKRYLPSFGRASSNWQIGTLQAFSHVIAVATEGEYEFRLVHTSSSDDDSITGSWDIYHDGSLRCDDCLGRIYGLDQAPGNYFKIVVGTPTTFGDRWRYSGYISQRFDY